MRMLFWTAFGVFVADQLSKLLVVQLLDLKTLGSMDIWSPYLNFRMAWNRGVNFGLFSSGTDVMRWVLIAVALVISTWVIWWMWRHKEGKFAHIAAGFLVGGAFGNIVDRLWYGAVADFLNMSCCGIDNPFAFNIADIAIFVGAIGLILFTTEKKTP